MTNKEHVYKELVDQDLQPGWVGSSIRIGTKLMVRFYPDCETCELLELTPTNWQSLTITSNPKVVAYIAKAQLQK